MKTNPLPFLVSAATALIVLAPAVHAGAVPDDRPARSFSPSNKEAFTLFNPTPTELMREMSTDRPDTTESPITVDAGHFQIEASALDYNRDKSAGVKTETWTVGAVNLKVGLLDRTDIQFVFDTYANSKSTGAGASPTAEGIGDLTVRLKQNLWGNEGDSKTAFALMPWVSAPTGSDDLSAGKYEGGLIAPLAFDIAAGVAAGLMIQGDVLWDAVASKYFVAWTHSATCGFEITDAVGVFVEYVGITDSGRAANYRAYGNSGVTFAISKNTVLDTGVRIGLNRAADDFGCFAGVSYRH